MLYAFAVLICKNFFSFRRSSSSKPKSNPHRRFLDGHAYVNVRSRKAFLWVSKQIWSHAEAFQRAHANSLTQCVSADSAPSVPVSFTATGMDRRARASKRRGRARETIRAKYIQRRTFCLYVDARLVLDLPPLEPQDQSERQRVSRDERVSIVHRTSEMTPERLQVHRVSCLLASVLNMRSFQWW